MRGLDRREADPKQYVVLVPGRAEYVEVDLSTIVARIWRGRYLVLMGALLFGALGAAHAYLATPWYRSEVVLSLRSGDLQGPMAVLRGQLGGLASLAGVDLGGSEGDRREEFLALLRSRELARQFIETRDLMPIIFASRWDPNSKQYRPGLFGRAPTIGDSVEYFTKRIRSVQEDPRTGLVTVAFQWTDPGLSARWANDYVALANETLRNEAIADAQKSLTYLNRELGRTTLEPVRQGLYRLMESHINQAMLASVEPEYAFKAIDRAEPAEPHRFVRPIRALEIAIGLLVGAILGGFVALWRHRSPLAGGPVPERQVNSVEPA